MSCGRTNAAGARRCACGCDLTVVDDADVARAIARRDLRTAVLLVLIVVAAAFGCAGFVLYHLGQGTAM